MNKVIMMGRLTMDPEMRYSTSGTGVGSFTLAVDRKYVKPGDPGADFYSCVSFGKTAEFVAKYLKKGVKVILDGHLQNDSYTNKDGVKMTITKIIVDQLEFAESKAASEQAPAPAPAPASNANAKEFSFSGIPEETVEELLEELPFK